MNSHIPTKAAAKCLGYWWSRDLLSNRSVEENIKEGLRMFFQVRYSRVIPGRLQPSTKSVIDTCVISVLLYGHDNWILMEKSLSHSSVGWPNEP